MKVLIIGGGGRAHAIGWKLRQCTTPPALYFAPGNGGTAQIGTNIEAPDIEALAAFAERESIDLTIVGPEAWLTAGIVDVFRARDLPIFGPDKRSAQLEGSKVLAKRFMKKYGVKTPASESFTTVSEAKAYLRGCDFPIVIKADGLAAGKGVIIAGDRLEAEAAVEAMMTEKRFGQAGEAVVIEEFLQGREASVLSLFNGREITPLRAARDHKKIGEGECGLNTGGMGAVVPNPDFDQSVEEAFESDILRPTLRGLSSEGYQFSGVIFFGLMLTSKGVYLLEYNLRMGDPETQAVLPLLESDLSRLIQDAMAGKHLMPKWKAAHSCCVVLASEGYPKSYRKGMEITGLDEVDGLVFIAGAQVQDGRYISSGGRVLSLTALGADPAEAREKAYAAVGKIRFEGCYCRGDIGL